jgi:hypothetical protein
MWLILEVENVFVDVDILTKGKLISKASKKKEAKRQQD